MAAGDCEMTSAASLRALLAFCSPSAAITCDEKNNMRKSCAEINSSFGPKCHRPVKILSLFLFTTPLQYVPKILFTPATIDCLTANKTKNALHKETVILSYIGVDPINHGLSN